MGRCCFCNIVQKRECGRTFHKFPLNNPRLLKEWLKNYPVKNWTPNRRSILCSDHFTEECFDNIQISGFDPVYRAQLKRNGIPTLFDNPQSYCMYCKRKRTQKSGYSFFKFPLDKPYLLQLWLDSMNIKNWTPNDNSLLCSQHFEQTCFRKKRGNYVTLKDKSIPTIFKVESLNDIKSAVLTTEIPPETNFSQNISLNNNDQFESSQLTFYIPFKDVVQTHSANRNVDKTLTSEKTENINVVDHDHYYDASPLALHRKLKESQEIIQSKTNIIKLQQQQLQCLKTRITGFKKTITKLRRQHMVSEN